MHLVKRDNRCFYDERGNIVDCEESFWYTQTGYIIKWCILLFIFVFFMTWFIGGYFHAQRRMKKNLPPLAYHRWLVPRRQRVRFEPHLNNYFTFYRTQGQQQHPNAYGMQNYPEPPPMYAHDAPPQYQPPPGASKMDPNQTYAQPQQPFPGYAPPPSHQAGSSSQAPLAPQETGTIGASNPGAGLSLPERAKTSASGILGRFRR